MFVSLLESFSAVKLYKINMLDDVAEKLNMTNMNVFNDNIDDIKDNNDTDNNTQLIRSKLMNIFGSFFKNNYEYILKLEAVSNDTLNKILTQTFSRC